MCQSMHTEFREQLAEIGWTQVLIFVYTHGIKQLIPHHSQSTDMCSVDKLIKYGI